jgi:hypothetical protein
MPHLAYRGYVSCAAKMPCFERRRFWLWEIRVFLDSCNNEAPAFLQIFWNGLTLTNRQGYCIIELQEKTRENKMTLNLGRTNDTEPLITGESHVIVHSFMRTDMELTNIEIWVFAVIYGFFMNGLTYCGSRKYLAEWAGCGLTSIDHAMSSLLKKGYIRKIGNYNKRTEYTVRIENLPSIPEHKRMIELNSSEKTV